MSEILDPPATFDLTSEPWIPVIRHGQEELVSLRAALVEAHDIDEVMGASPLITFAIMRLLIAVAHRVVDGPVDEEAWEAVWMNRSFDASRVDAYLDQWQDRFDLFHPEQPFMQVRFGAETKPKSVAQLSAAMASSYNAALLFDHTLDARFTPAEAAQGLLARLAFGLGGTMTPWPGKSDTLSGNSDAPNARHARILVRGANLFETITLNLTAYDPADTSLTGRPDRPSWERPPLTERGSRRPDGWLDLLTWRGFAIELFRGDGGLVTGCVICGGEMTPKDLAAHETLGSSGDRFVSFYWFSRKDEQTYVPINLRLGRAMWRDSLALLTTLSPSIGEYIPPANVVWIARLARSRVGGLERHAILPIDVIGISTVPAQSKIMDWRHERIAVPMTSVITDRFEYLAAAITRAERVASMLQSSTGPMCHLSGNGDSRDVARLIAALVRLEPYWATLDQAFPLLLRSEDPDEATEEWNRVVRRAADEVIRETLGAVEGTPRGVIAAGEVETHFRALMTSIERRSEGDQPVEMTA